MTCLKKLAVPGIILLLLTTTWQSCVRDNDFFPEGTGESKSKAIVKFAGAENEFILYARDVNPAMDTFILIDLRRDVVNPGDLNQPLTVRLVLSPTLISEYNQANGSNYIPLPTNAYTLSEDINNITFQPGEFSKQIRIIINKAQLSLANQYAIAFTIAEVGPGGVISSTLRNIVYGIAIKNAYDGKYRLKGQFYHPTPANQGFFTFDMEMHTSGANSVKMYWPLGGGYGHPWTTNGAPTWFGLQEPNYTINPVTNKVTVQNVAAGAVTFYTMAPNYDSRYDPATRTIYAKFGYNYSPGPVFNPATNREWTDTLTYTGPR